MQLDTDLSFADIHGSPNTMLASIKEIQTVALFRETTNWLTLRFLSRVEPQPKGAKQSGKIYLNLSPLGPVPPKYVAVSYTWQRSDTPSKSIPQYCIITPNKRIILPFPELNFVIHRALRFVSDRDIHYFWIDRLCVDQDDPNDVEMHIQCMHTVYANSTYTFAPLSCRIDTTSMLHNLKGFLQDRSQHNVRDPRRWAKKVQGLLEFIVRDGWFTRTWTYQERFCGKDVYLEFHLASLLRVIAGGADHMLVRLHDIQSAFERFETAITKAADGKPRDEMSFLITHLQQIMSLNFDFPRLSRTNTPETLNASLSKRSFDVLQTCNCFVVSDRLAVVANIGNYIYRLKSRQLNEPRFSYSTALLVLILSNGWYHLRIDTPKFFRLRMHATVSEIIGEFLANTPESLVPMPGTTRHTKPIYIVDDPEERWSEAYVTIPVLTIEELESLTIKAPEDPGTGTYELTRCITRHDSHANMIRGNIGQWFKGDHPKKNPKATAIMEHARESDFDF
jgi:hypothetical protein